MRNTIAVTFSLVFLSGSAMTWAAESLSGAVEKAVLRSPSVMAAHAQLDGAQSAVSEIRSTRWPRLSVRSVVQRGDNPVYVFGSLLEQQSFGAENFAIDSLNNPGDLTNIKNALDLDVPLFRAFETSTGEKQRKLAVEQASQRAAMSEQAVRYQTVDAYLEALAQKQTLALLEQRIDSANKEIEDAKRLNAKGLVLGSDFYAALSVQSALKAKRESVRVALESAKSQLALLIGEPVTLVDPVGRMADPVYLLASEDVLVANALRSRHDVKDAELQVAIADSSVEQSKNGLWPTVSAFASIETNTEDFSSNPSNHMVGVKSLFPIGNPGYAAQKSNARAAARYTRDQKQAVEEAVRRDVVDARRAVASVSAQLSLMTDAERQSEKALELFRPLYREGRQSILDVLRAEESLVSAQMSRLQAQHQGHRGYARLMLAAGELDADALKKMESQLAGKP